MSGDVKLTKAEAEVFVDAYEFELECWVFRRRMDKAGFEAVRVPPDEPVPYDLKPVDMGRNELSANNAFYDMARNKAIDAGLAALTKAQALDKQEL